ncbi:putative minimal binding motif of Hap4 for binding to Hap2/3/5 [Lyophyllum shimeji]|uniref:Minimal binding motif of Hap4 for binding to Hap2/3/5 n=1 Tax=Lyophyllum shimeji TaxID=47721 RepID=A0A9P3PHX5_LYOSH|nr:putative minimal binding motif of Hap4 for binding to Hap2/3/5 [Lyophyllum shimeji]
MVAPAVANNPISSSSTLWATASKEWVIAPKPKPGRKPKKDNVTPSKPEDDGQTDNKGRRVQNRAAQRAFRERKQTQLAELQARVQSYEQGEIERNVALQNIAKRLKEENERLRAENSLLKEKLSKAEPAQATLHENDKKRWRDDTPLSNPASKRVKSIPDSPRNAASPLTASYSHSPPSMVSSPDSSGTSDTRCSPLPSYEVQPTDAASMSNLLDFSCLKPSQLDGSGFSAFDCGFCSEGTPCVCRELVAQQAHALERVNFKASNNYDPATATSALHPTNTIQLEPPPAPCILENLPPYQAPVPLRRRTASSNVNTIFAVAPPTQRAPANCSGDPSNCMACAGDAFGKAFCSAIEKSVASQEPCADCPCSQDASAVPAQPVAFAGCCTRPSSCACRSSMSLYTPSDPASSTAQTKPETMPTNDAWRQIKSHPNVSFADLSLLAEVVARRSKCMGPRVVISPAPGSITPERTVSPGANNIPAEHEPVLLTDPHAHYREKERARSNGPPASPRLVPQDVLVRCGRQRVREVETEAVRAALRLLDAKFA